MMEENSQPLTAKFHSPHAKVQACRSLCIEEYQLAIAGVQNVWFMLPSL